MSYIFKAVEKEKIINGVNGCEGMWFDAGKQVYQAVAIKGRHCAPFYRALSDVIDERLSEPSFSDDAVRKTLKSAKLWLDVAIDANGGSGAYSALIRAYTIRQGQLRLNKVFSDELIQQSSNQVAVNFVNTLINGSPSDNLAPWTIPAINQIASIDARAIGEILFRHDIDDTASSRNSGWSGTIAFSLLGGKYPYETWRLISAGDPGSEIEGRHESAVLNRVDDFKNVLFAIDSYNMAITAVIKNFGWNSVESFLSVVPEQINVARSSGSYSPLIQHVVKNTPISATVDFVLRYGVNAFFDMFKLTYDGIPPVVPTTDETFAARAFAFFSTFSSSQSQTIVARPVSEFGSVSEWKALAAQGTSIGSALRNSLKYLSEIVIERDDNFIGRGLELYDQKSGEGMITEQWIIDRADMLGRLISRLHASFGENTSQLYSYSDLASGKQVPLATGVLNPLVMFSDDGGRSFGGGPNSDHLYGALGGDVIEGATGNDYIEGGHGNDSLKGGDGNDVLHGMSGDDLLVGGIGNDILIGGAGDDHYEFSSGDGVDQIFDLDVGGRLLINGLPIPVLKRNGPLSNTWITENHSVTVTLVEDSIERTLNIKYGPNDVIVIKNYRPGMLGLQLPDYVSQPVSKPDLVVTGDFKAIDTDPDVSGDQVSHDDLGNVLVMPDVKQRNRADVLYGAPSDDLLIGLGGSDRLLGNAGNDRLFGDKVTTFEKALAGGAGRGKNSRGDWLDGGEGDDLLVGTPSRDVLLGGNGRDTLVGGAGDDNLSGDETTGELAENWDFKRVDVSLGDGTVSHRNVNSDASYSAAAEGGNDLLYGQGGRDFINGGWGDDLLDGGTENDLLGGDGGNDTLIGGDGDDTLLGDNLDWAGGLQSRHHGNDLLIGGNGNDSLAGNGGNDMLYGGAGNDDLDGDDPVLHGIEGDAAIYFGADLLDGGAGDDTLQGGGAGDSLYGGAGNDDLSGDYADHPIRYHGDDLLDGGTGDDTLRGMGGSDTLIGGQGNDALDGDEPNLQAGGTNDDYVQGDAGNDTLWGGLGADTLLGGADDDLLVGDYEQTPETEQGSDYLDGGSGNDTLLGGVGNDTLLGGSGVDYLRGDAGNNLFVGGPGNDYLDGQDGDDIFYFGSGDGLDVIADAGGKNLIKFGYGFTAESLKADIIAIDVGPVLRLANPSGDAVLLRDYEKWQGSYFTFNDGTTLNFEDVMRLVRGPEEKSPSPGFSQGTGAGDEGFEVSKAPSDAEQPGGEGDAVEQVQTEHSPSVPSHPEGESSVSWEELFLANMNTRRSARRLATGFVKNIQGTWIKSHVTDGELDHGIKTTLIVESFHDGSVSDFPTRDGLAPGKTVSSERLSSTSSRTESRPVVKNGRSHLTAEPQYYRSGSIHGGILLKPGDIVVEDKNESGVLRGWYVYPAGSFENREIEHKNFSWEVTTETIRHQIFQAGDVGGRINLEVGNVGKGGFGDDLIVTYKEPQLYYGDEEERVPGAFLSGGAGNDTLVGSEGPDYLVNGSGNDWLYGEDGQDTYVIEAHDGATTVVVDMLNPVYIRPEVGVAEWRSEFGESDLDTVRLPDGITVDQLKLAWGTVLVEAVNVELDPNPRRGAQRNAPRAQMLYSTLDITWGTAQQVRIVLPNSSDLNGSGIELLAFSDGSSVKIDQLIANSKFGPAPDTYNHGVLISNAAAAHSFRDNKMLPIVGGRGNDTLSGSGEIRGMQGDDYITGGAGNDVIWGGAGNDTLTGGAGDDLYVYDGLGRDLIVNKSGGTDGIDFTYFDVSIHQLKFHRDENDLVIVVNFGVSPKLRVANHFLGGDAAITFVRVQGQDRMPQDVTADQFTELLHPLPPLRDVEDILPRQDESAAEALAEIIKFYELPG